MVAQGVRGQNGHQVFLARGFSSPRRHERKVRTVPGRQRNHRQRHCHRESNGENRLVQELRHPRSARLERSRRRPVPSKSRHRLRAQPSLPPTSKNRLDLGVNGNVRGGKAVDREFPAAAFGEAKKTADVVILLVSRKKTLGFGGRESEGGKCDRPAKFTGMQTVGAHEFAEGHEGSASGGFGAHGFLLGRVYLVQSLKKRSDRKQRGLAVFRAVRKTKR